MSLLIIDCLGQTFTPFSGYAMYLCAGHDLPNTRSLCHLVVEITFMVICDQFVQDLKKHGHLNKLKHFLPLHAKVLIYNSSILSHLNISILTWGYQCVRILKLQKSIIRIISLSIYNTHTEKIFKTTKLLI